MQLSARRRSIRANRFIMDNLDDLRKEFRVQRIPQTMFNQLRRSVK